MKTLRKFLAKFAQSRSDGLLRDTAGSIAMMTALGATAFILAGGTAVDFARASRQRQILNAAVDSAALALATSKITDTAALKAMGEKYVKSNLAAISSYDAGPLTLDINIYTDRVTINAVEKMPTTMMKIVDINNMDLSVYSEARRVTANAEVTLVLDNTGSMAGTKIAALKTAANQLNDILFGTDTTSTHLKVAIVPFAASVNVGKTYKTATWMDTTGKNAISKLNFTDTTKYGNWAYGQMSNTPWFGCVEQRKANTTTINYDVDDTVPNVATPDTLFPFYFAPDEATDSNSASSQTGWGTFSNDYLADWRSNESVSSNTKKNTTLDARQRRYEKYVATTPSGSGKGPSYNCGTAAVTPLTNVKKTITDQIAAMVATGNTNLASGIGWGLRVLSPTAPFTEGAAYNDKKWHKVMIVMTDGENDWGDVSNMNKTLYGGYGYPTQSSSRLGIASVTNTRTTLDGRTAKACAVAKAASTNPEQPIVIYTITFGSIDTQAKNLMKACASDVEKYFHAPDNNTLITAFKTIATEISQVYLSK